MMTVVGIVGDIRARGFGDKPEPLMYFPYAQSAKSAYYVPRSMALLIHTHGNPLLHGDEVRRAIQSIDRTVPVSEIRTFDEVAGTSVALRRFNTLLIAAFAALALVLAGIGTYGVISYGVSQRRFEIGVRMALGAEDRSVMGLVMREGLRLAFVGLVLGVGASVLVGRAIQAMLVGVGALDLPSIAVTGVLLGVVALTASFVPAIRALRVNPIEALRVE
jgi:ABC-type antimicrobial peptide transport system permease subunit